MMNGYLADLAFIHERGFNQYALGAASVVIQNLSVMQQDCRTVVDLGCGGGTLAGELCKAGYGVHGFDSSEEMISLARAKAPNATFTVGSFINAELPHCVAVTAIGEVFNYLFDERNNEHALKNVLRNIYQSLCPGGFLLFDIAGPERVNALPGRSFATNDDWCVVLSTSICDGILKREITSFRRLGDLFRRTDEVHRLRLIDPKDMFCQLTEIGFTAVLLEKYGAVSLPRGLHAFLATK